MEMPILQDAHRRFHGIGLAIIGLDVVKSLAQMPDFSNEHGFAYPFASEPTRQQNLID